MNPAFLAAVIEGGLVRLAVSARSPPHFFSPSPFFKNGENKSSGTGRNVAVSRSLDISRKVGITPSRRHERQVLHRDFRQLARSQDGFGVQNLDAD